jgi:hypothetical protein
MSKRLAEPGIVGLYPANCDHKWIEVTATIDDKRSQICVLCGLIQFAEWPPLAQRDDLETLYIRPAGWK